MSYKNAMAGLPLGGGKAVVMVDRADPKSPRLLEAFGRLVDSLRRTLHHCRGRRRNGLGHGNRRHPDALRERPATHCGDADGNPAPKTALGVYLGIKAAVKFQLGRSSLRGVTVGVQGLGGVGHELCGLLAADGASLRVADVRAEAVQRVVQGIRCPCLAAERNPVRAR